MAVSARGRVQVVLRARRPGGVRRGGHRRVRPAEGRRGGRAACPGGGREAL